MRSTVALPLLWAAWLVAVRGLSAAPRGWWAALAVPDRVKLVVGSGLVAGAVAMILFYAALNVGESSRIKPIAFSLASATAVLLGGLLLGESRSWRQAIAVLMILGGVVRCRARQRRGRRPPRPRRSQ